MSRFPFATCGNMMLADQMRVVGLSNKENSMASVVRGKSVIPRMVPLCAKIAIAAVLILSALTNSAEAAPHSGGGGGGHFGGGGGRGHGGWGGGYYAAPPLIYGSPFYCTPPLIYVPGYGYGNCE